jgi:stress-induced morphogen
LINDCLSEELAGPIHALNLKVRTPSEDQQDS